MSAPVVTLENVRFRYPGADRDALAGLDLHRRRGRDASPSSAPTDRASRRWRACSAGLARPAAGRRAVACGCDLLTAAGRQAARREVGVLLPEPREPARRRARRGGRGLRPREPRLGHRRASARAPTRCWPGSASSALRRREPHLLSGGQKQRTALAGVLAIPRRVLVLDEPTAMLDAAGRDEVLDGRPATARRGSGRRHRHPGDGRGRARRPGRGPRTRQRGVRRAPATSSSPAATRSAACAWGCRSRARWRSPWRRAVGRCGGCRSTSKSWSGSTTPAAPPRANSCGWESRGRPGRLKGRRPPQVGAGAAGAPPPRTSRRPAWTCAAKGSRSPTTRAAARCRRCRTSRSPSGRGRPWRCSGPRARASRRCSR